MYEKANRIDASKQPFKYRKCQIFILLLFDEFFRQIKVLIEVKSRESLCFHGFLFKFNLKIMENVNFLEFLPLSLHHVNTSIGW